MVKRRLTFTPNVCLQLQLGRATLGRRTIETLAWTVADSSSCCRLHGILVFSRGAEQPGAQAVYQAGGVDCYGVYGEKLGE